MTCELLIGRIVDCLLKWLFNLFIFLMQPFPYIPTITNHTQLWWVPNVVVAHQKEGIEAIHLASGRTFCKVNKMPAQFPS